MIRRPWDMPIVAGLTATVIGAGAGSLLLVMAGAFVGGVSLVIGLG